MILRPTLHYGPARARLTPHGRYRERHNLGGAFTWPKKGTVPRSADIELGAGQSPFSARKEEGEMWKDDEEYGPMIARLGPRLRELRRRAGLTQEELARRMGMSSPNKKMMVQIENGRTGNPGLASVARYLRACRAGFVDVLDVLDSYTRQAPVPEARAARAIAELESRLKGEVRINRKVEVDVKVESGSGEAKSQKAKGKSQNGGERTAKDAKIAKDGNEERGTMNQERNRWRL